MNSEFPVTGRTAEAICSQTTFPETEPVRIVSFWRVRDQRYLAKSPWEHEDPHLAGEVNMYGQENFLK